jgi:hypothetical protein
MTAMTALVTCVTMGVAGHDAHAATSKGGTGPAAKAQLEQALACTAIATRFERAESLLKGAGWRPDQGVTPVTLAEPLQVYGFSIRKVAVSRDGFEHTYRSYVPGSTIPQLVKAASLKLGKDRTTYGRVTKAGVLSAEMEGNEATLTCTVDTESGED